MITIYFVILCSRGAFHNHTLEVPKALKAAFPLSIVFDVYLAITKALLADVFAIVFEVKIALASFFD